MSAGLPKCIRCHSPNTQAATVLGSRPHERWFRCEYCRRFFAVRADGDSTLADEPPPRVPAAAAAPYSSLARLILAEK